MLAAGPLLAVLVLHAPVEAPIPGPPEAKAQAQVLLREGTRFYRNHQFQEALARFNEAYALYPSPKLHFNVGQANRELARPVEARAAFERFLAEAVDAPRPAVEEARRSLAELRRQLGQIQLECPTAGVEVTIDGAPAGRTPLPATIWVTPGRHDLALRGRRLVPFEESVEVRAGGTVTVTPLLRKVDLLPSPYVLGRPMAAAPVDRGPGQQGLWPRVRGRWWFWAAVAAVAVGGGITTAIMLGGGHDAPPSRLGLHEIGR
jgi:hypothetical protein